MRTQATLSAAQANEHANQEAPPMRTQTKLSFATRTQGRSESTNEAAGAAKKRQKIAK
jgi:hypothetical protein